MEQRSRYCRTRIYEYVEIDGRYRLSMALVSIVLIYSRYLVLVYRSGNSAALVLKMRGELEWENADQAFPALMMHVLPSGLRGLVAAGLMAALMSSLASVFNSCSTLFTMDIYKKIKPAASEKQMVTVGRLATGVVVLLGILWVPVIEKVYSLVGSITKEP